MNFLRHVAPFAVGILCNVCPTFFGANAPAETAAVSESESLTMPEPTYKGKTLTIWLEALGNTPAGPEYPPAANAIRQMGAAAVPYLLKIIESPDATRENASRAVNAFRELGAQAKEGIPDLSNLLLKDFSSPFAAEALVAIGADAPVIKLLSQDDKQLRRNAVLALASHAADAEAIRPLVALLQEQDDELRALAAWALGSIFKEDKLSVPALAQSLNDRNASVRSNAATALGNFKSESSVSIPALIRAQADSAESVRDAATFSLGRLLVQCPAVERKQIVAALVQSLDDPSNTVRISAAWALGRSLSECKAAVPRLLEIAKGPSGQLSGTATNSLRHIDPESATKPGLK